MSKYLCVFLAAFVLLGCDNKSAQSEVAVETPVTDPIIIETASITNDNAKTVLDYVGTYTGILPVGDDLQTLTLTLDQNTYINHSGDNDIAGNYVWNEQGNIINLQDDQGNVWLKLFVAENRLFAVDENDQWRRDNDNQIFALNKQ